MRKLTMIRRVDALGRIVIPIELRKMLSMESGQDVEMSVQGETLILHRFLPGCIFCGQYEKLLIYEGKHICEQCRRRISAGR